MTSVKRKDRQSSNPKKKRCSVYVAGHSGLAGSAICRHLTDRGYTDIKTMSSRKLDLRRQRETEDFFKRNTFQHVYLAAAKVGGILANSTYTAEFIYDNMMIAANVINAAYRTGVKKLLNLGSSCIYPRAASQPLREEYLMTGKLEPTNEPYAVAKIAALKLCRYYNQQFDTNFITITPNNLYGPGDNFDFETSHVLPSLVRKFHLAKLLTEKKYDSVLKDFEMFGNGIKTNDVKKISGYLAKFGVTADFVAIWGSGEPSRDFLYVDDMADASVYVMERFDKNEIGEFINIGYGMPIKIMDIAKTIKQVVNYDGAITCDLNKPDGMPKKILDISRIKALGWEPKTSLLEGIRKTYSWYLDRLS